MVSGECETILNSSGDTFLVPPMLSSMPQPPNRVAQAATYPEWKPGSEFKAIRDKMLNR